MKSDANTDSGACLPLARAADGRLLPSFSERAVVRALAVSGPEKGRWIVCRVIEAKPFGIYHLRTLPKVGGDEHVAREGETPEQIAAACGVSLAGILALNARRRRGLSHDSRLSRGEVIELPNGLEGPQDLFDVPAEYIQTVEEGIVDGSDTAKVAVNQRDRSGTGEAKGRSFHRWEGYDPFAAEEVTSSSNEVGGEPRGSGGDKPADGQQERCSERGGFCRVPTQPSVATLSQQFEVRRRQQRQRLPAPTNIFARIQQEIEDQAYARELEAENRRHAEHAEAEQRIREACLALGAPWQPDEEATNCPLCSREFDLFLWQHHCRACGAVVCDDCSLHRAPCVGWEDLERVCDECMPKLAQQNAFLATTTPAEDREPVEV